MEGRYLEAYVTECRRAYGQNETNPADDYLVIR